MSFFDGGGGVTTAPGLQALWREVFSRSPDAEARIGGACGAGGLGPTQAGARGERPALGGGLGGRRRRRSCPEPGKVTGCCLPSFRAARGSSITGMAFGAWRVCPFVPWLL